MKLKEQSDNTIKKLNSEIQVNETYSFIFLTRRDCPLYFSSTFELNCAIECLYNFFEGFFFFFQGMKSIRVKLMRQMKEESERFRALKAQKEKEIYQLKEQVSCNLIRPNIANSLLSRA